MALPYTSALASFNARDAWHQRRQFLLTSLIMFSQNSLFFAIWIIFFGVAGNVRGWTLSDLMIFNGVVTFGLGVALLAADGTRKIGTKIISGELDIYLVRSRHPLPQMMFTQANNASLGDMAFGLGLMAWAGVDTPGWLLAGAASLLICVLFLAVTVCLQTLAFYVRGGDRLSDSLFETMICLGTIPQQAQSGLMKLLLFTVLPAGFMVVLSVEIVRQHSLQLLLWLACATLGYSLLAIAAFNFGLRRYTSATGWKV
jgi:ABC-2 type transport system permease protein